MAAVAQGGWIDARPHPGGLRWAAVQAAKAPGAPNGDGYLISRTDSGVLMALADGVGSGAPAHEATMACLAAVAENLEADLPQIYRRCHSDLIGTRGAALGIVLIDLARQRLFWAALGDIDICQFHPSQTRAIASVIQRGGTLGHISPSPLVQEIALRPGSMVVMCTDGISRSYRLDPPGSRSPEEYAQAVFARFGRDHDDRSVLSLGFEAPSP